MTQPLETSEPYPSEFLPTPWRYIDLMDAIEVRQLSLDTFEIRSPRVQIQVNREGFDAYRQDADTFEDWCTVNNVEPKPRVFDE